ncbi:hypothetical protein RchiOBHm_Chr2g0111961 [Rosa chinensis]|uniref:Uncharacterized protein n=1 Tax=Rosa chinensis TaxID=74649 RepID=A0A2P6RQ39_ROSCH|nr:hypothetical protein RchiOBHm_Chr2g0111961 [Rosa chinensis]
MIIRCRLVLLGCRLSKYMELWSHSAVCASPFNGKTTHATVLVLKENMQRLLRDHETDCCRPPKSRGLIMTLDYLKL